MKCCRQFWLSISFDAKDLWPHENVIVPGGLQIQKKNYSLNYFKNELLKEGEALTEGIFKWLMISS
jgi:hypothetical protein